MTEAPTKVTGVRPAAVTYTAVITAGDDGWFCAQIPAVPEAISQGRTLREARANIQEALRLALEWRIAEGETLPEPVAVTVSQVTVLSS